MINKSEFNRPLGGSEIRDVEFKDYVSLRCKIKGKWVPALFIKGIHIREEDYQKLFS